MSQCVPSWDLDDDEPFPSKFYIRSHSNSSCPDDPILSDYEIAELTWENGQLSLHGLGLPRVPYKPITTTTATTTVTATSNSCPTKYTWEKPRASGTLESIVNQATRLPHHEKQAPGGSTADELVPWIEHQKAPAAATALASSTMTMDALVPCSNRRDDRSTNLIDPSQHDLGNCVVGCSTHVESCSEATTHDEDRTHALLAAKRTKAAHLPVTQEWSSRVQSESTSGTSGMGRSQHMSVDTYEKDLGLVFTSTSMGSHENTNSGKQCTKANTCDDHDSVSHCRPQAEGHKEKNKDSGKSSVSTKRSRAAAVHNQSERKRRDKINQRMKTLQKLVPNSSKTDKASMLDEVIEYLKQLQAQVQMMSRLSMSPIMLPMAIQQQFQMSSMMAPMGMGLGMVGMGMGMGTGTGTAMDVNSIGRRPNIPGVPPILHPALFVPMPTWDGSTDHHRLQTPPTTLVPADPLSTFLACQQPMTMDQYSRMAAMYQQLHQPPATNSKS